MTAPTGSGKTLIAEKGVEKYINDGLKVIYTTPIKALSNQKYHDFKHLGFDTGLLKLSYKGWVLCLQPCLV